MTLAPVLTTLLDDPVQGYSAFKSWMEATTGSTQELMHVHAGLAIFVLAALLTRRPLRSFVPIGTVAALGLLNEVADWLAGKPLDTSEPYLDFANTLLWPLILFLLARRFGPRVREGARETLALPERIATRSAEHTERQAPELIAKPVQDRRSEEGAERILTPEQMPRCAGDQSAGQTWTGSSV